MAVARKLFRLFKSFNEVQTIIKTLKADSKPVDKYLAVLTRLAFLFYWFFDNLSLSSLLSSPKLCNWLDYELSRRLSLCISYC